MKTRTVVNKLICVALTVVLIVGCACMFCGCHVFAWYIPKQYSEEDKAEIYGYIRNDLLTELNHYIANVSLVSKTNGVETYGYYNVFASEGKIIMNISEYADTQEKSYAVWYNGTLKKWDVANRSETVTSVSIDEYRFLFEYITKYANFIKTRVVDVASYRSDSYFHECFPWGMGMAQVYYDDIDGMSVTGSWTVEKSRLVKQDGLPLVFNAEFQLSTLSEGISLDVYGSPYGIDERVTNIINGYERYKRPDTENGASD